MYKQVIIHIHKLVDCHLGHMYPHKSMWVYALFKHQHKQWTPGTLPPLMHLGASLEEHRSMCMFVLQQLCHLSLSHWLLCCAAALALMGNTVLTELRLRGCGIDAEGTSKLVKALLNIKTLSELDLSANIVDSRGARHLGKFSHAWGYGLTCNIWLWTERCLIGPKCLGIQVQKKMFSNENKCMQRWNPQSSKTR